MPVVVLIGFFSNIVDVVQFKDPINTRFDLLIPMIVYLRETRRSKIKNPRNRKPIKTASKHPILRSMFAISYPFCWITANPVDKQTGVSEEPVIVLLPGIGILPQSIEVTSCHWLMITHSKAYLNHEIHFRGMK